MGHRDDHALPSLKPVGKGRGGAADNFDTGVAAYIFEACILDKDAGKKAGFQQDLEPVANPHHRAAACSVVQNGLHDRRARGKGAAAKIVAIGEAAGDDHQIGGIKAIFLVPDQCRPPSCQLLDGNHHVAVTVRPRENGDRDAKRAQAHASSPSSISIS